ncbi:MAG TPA: PQQ-binding-like beta-propeller repeat protein, partial [Pyrinomonadaceae bacterium]|nr:PQQ-binding-like beta-propeller repeat protein [Pyrinomonadaceae bacterium]
LTFVMGYGQKTAGKPEQPFVKCWEIEQSASLAAAPVTDNGTVFLAEAGGVVRAVNSETGEAEWSMELGGAVVSNLLIDGDHLYLATTPVGDSDASILRMLDAKSGIVRKTASIAASDKIWLGSAEAGIVIIAASGQATKLSHDLNETRWTAGLGTQLAAPPDLAHGRIAAALELGRIVMLDSVDGAIVLDERLESKPTSVAVVGPDAIIAGDAAGNLHRLANAGKSWSLKTGGSISHIVSVEGGTVTAASFDNFLYSVNSGSGRVEWRKRTAGRIIHRPISTGRYVISAAVGEPHALVTDIKGNAVNRIELGEGNYVINAPAFSLGGSVIISMPGAVAAFSNTGCSTAK